MSASARRQGVFEPLVVFAGALLGSVAAWGRLWVTAPSSRGVCGCGDPSLFQWFLAWPEHAIATGHSLVFSRDLFYPHGVNLLANTSVLALGVLLAPVTWLGGPVLTDNLALLLAVPVAAITMDLFLRRVTSSMLARVVLCLLYAFSPYVVASLAVSHLMTAWIGILPLIALGAVDAVSDDVRRARRGQVLLFAALVVQFFVSTELLLLAALVAVVALVVQAVSWLIAREVPPTATVTVRRLAVPVAAAGIVLVVPTYYALLGPRSLKGNIWGPQFNPVTGGTSVLDLLRAHVTVAKLTIASGYRAPVVQLQYLGWGLLAVTALFTVWRWRDPIVRVTAVTSLVCLVLALSPKSVSWAPWQWLGKLPLLQNVLQFRIVVFALGGCIVVVARGVDALSARGRVGLVAGGALLALAVVPVAVPVADSLPLRTVTVSIPQWWRSPPGAGVVLGYPFPSLLIQSPLTWQAHSGFGVPMLGGGGPQADPWRAGADEHATELLGDLSNPLVRTPPPASPGTAGPIREMIARDGVTEVVVPVEVRGSPLATGRPSPVAAVFFAQVLGVDPRIRHGAWVFDARSLGRPRYVTPARARRCERSARADPAGLVSCLFGATA